MITDVFIEAIYKLVGVLVGFLPLTPAAPGIADKAAALAASGGGALASVGVMPLATLATAVIAVRLAFLAFGIFRTLVWVLTAMHISGGKG